LDQFKIETNKRIKDMSKGTKSKLMLAISLTYSPSLLIFDEITSGLDPIIRNTILQILKDYVKASKATIFFSTHITSDLENIANEVLLLHEGKIYFHKTMKELHEDYLIYKCNFEKYHGISKNGIERVLKNDNNYFLLAQRNCACKESFNEYKIPLVEDIMHFYIEGEACQ
ncbi:MAG: AAA family ATPase, partial [Bacillus cereus]|nr:AAA family ATPase [Bacillus cereus]